MMRMIYFVHILAGSFALIFGYVALAAMKGATLHRRSGMLFVFAMLVMCVMGATMAIVRSTAAAVNVPAASLTAYLVITSLTTVRLPVWWPRWLDVALMLVALAIGLTTLTFGIEAVNSGGKRNGMPAFPFFMFATIALLASVLDARMIRAGGLKTVRGASRLARHLWRMSYALFIAALSFFIGQQAVIPKPIRIPALLAIPVLIPLIAMFYWLWRVRGKRISWQTRQALSS